MEVIYNMHSLQVNLKAKYIRIFLQYAHIVKFIRFFFFNVNCQNNLNYIPGDFGIYISTIILL